MKPFKYPHHVWKCKEKRMTSLYTSRLASESPGKCVAQYMIVECASCSMCSASLWCIIVVKQPPPSAFLSNNTFSWMHQEMHPVLMPHVKRGVMVWKPQMQPSIIYGRQTLLMHYLALNKDPSSFAIGGFLVHQLFWHHYSSVFWVSLFQHKTWQNHYYNVYFQERQISHFKWIPL